MVFFIKLNLTLKQERPKKAPLKNLLNIPLFEMLLQIKSKGKDLWLEIVINTIPELFLKSYITFKIEERLSYPGRKPCV